MTRRAAGGQDPESALQLWLWLQREGWGLIPGAPPLISGFRASEGSRVAKLLIIVGYYYYYYY